jgi:hypothetical protein
VPPSRGAAVSHQPETRTHTLGARDSVIREQLCHRDERSSVVRPNIPIPKPCDRNALILCAVLNRLASSNVLVLSQSPWPFAPQSPHAAACVLRTEKPRGRDPAGFPICGSVGFFVLQKRGVRNDRRRRDVGFMPRMLRQRAGRVELR